MPDFFSEGVTEEALRRGKLIVVPLVGLPSWPTRGAGIGWGGKKGGLRAGRREREWRNGRWFEGLFKRLSIDDLR